MKGNKRPEPVFEQGLSTWPQRVLQIERKDRLRVGATPERIFYLENFLTSEIGKG
jgi:hypothetical protein